MPTHLWIRLAIILFFYLGFIGYFVYMTRRSFTDFEYLFFATMALVFTTLLGAPIILVATTLDQALLFSICWSIGCFTTMLTGIVKMITYKDLFKTRKREAWERNVTLVADELSKLAQYRPNGERLSYLIAVQQQLLKVIPPRWPWQRWKIDN